MALLLFALFVSVPASAGAPRLTWYGHATFQLESPKGTKILIDPFLTGNPKAPTGSTGAGFKPDAILLTHAHFDHTADAEKIALRAGSKVVGSFDHIKTLELPDAQKVGGNVGGRIVIRDVIIHIVPAMHGSSPGGRPVGFVVELDAKNRVYHTGDTWIFQDMALIQEIFQPTTILLQAGGGPFNQSPEVAALAVKKYFSPQFIVPMHFGTWPVLATEKDVRKAFKGDPRVKILVPGKSLELP